MMKWCRMFDGMDPRPCELLQQNCISWRRGWMNMREERLRRHQRMRRSRDARPADLGHGAFGVRADCWGLSSKDDAAVSTPTATSYHHVYESWRRECKGGKRSGFADSSLPCAGAE